LIEINIIHKKYAIIKDRDAIKFRRSYGVSSFKQIEERMKAVSGNKWNDKNNKYLVINWKRFSNCHERIE
jgi:hypothetical protein